MLPPIRFLSLALVALTAALARKPEDIADYPPLERIGFDQTANEVQAGGKLPQVPLVVLAADFTIFRTPELLAGFGLPAVVAS